jgi:hypothetical protein
LLVSVLAAFVVPCIGFNAAGAGEGMPTKAKRAPLPRYTEAEIRAVVDEVVPHVEQVMGRKFKVIPPLVIDDTEAVARILAADMEPEYRRENPTLSDSEIRRRTLAAARRYAPELLGKYGVKAEKLGLLPKNLAGTLAEHRIDPKHATGILKTLLAHELTHAIQAQYVDLMGMLAGAKTDDAQAASTAVIEGQAMFVQEQVGDALKLGPAAREYSRIFSLESQDFPDPNQRTVAAHQEFTYLEGKRFAEWHYREGGSARLWDILAKPPAVTAMIARPATYAPTAPPRPDLAPAFAGMAPLWRKRGWVVEERELGEIDLRAAYASADRDTIDALTEPVRAARQLAVQAPEAPARFRVTAFDMATPDAAARTLELLGKPISAEVAALEKSGSVRARRFEARAFGRVTAHASREYVVHLEDGHGRILVDRRVVLVARHTRLVEVVIDDYAMPNRELRSMVEQALGGTARKAE